LPNVNDPEFWDKILPENSAFSLQSIDKKLKKNKKEI